MVHCRVNWTYLQYGITKRRQSIKGTTQNGPTVCVSFLKRACGCEYAHGQIQNVILPSWISGMGVHCDIFTTLTLAGFIFWVIAQLDVYSGVSMRTMKVLFQQCCNYGEIWEYILSQFTVGLTGIIGIENRNRVQGWKWQFKTQLSLKYQPIMKKNPYN